MSQNKKPSNDRSGVMTPWIKIMHETYLSQGTMVAFPTCFPGATIPIVYISWWVAYRSGWFE